MEKWKDRSAAASKPQRLADLVLTQATALGELRDQGSDWYGYRIQPCGTYAEGTVLWCADTKQPGDWLMGFLSAQRHEAFHRFALGGPPIPPDYVCRVVCPPIMLGSASEVRGDIIRALERVDIPALYEIETATKLTASGEWPEADQLPSGSNVTAYGGNALGENVEAVLTVENAITFEAWAEAADWIKSYRRLNTTREQAEWLRSRERRGLHCQWADDQWLSEIGHDPEDRA